MPGAWAWRHLGCRSYTLPCLEGGWCRLLRGCRLGLEHKESPRDEAEGGLTPEPEQRYWTQRVWAHILAVSEQPCELRHVA